MTRPFDVAEPPAWAAPPLSEIPIVPAWAGDEHATQLSRAAAYQIAKAYAGSGLASSTQAEDQAVFVTPALDHAHATISAGYWLAVAARMLRSRTLAARAQAYVAQGVALDLVPGSGEMTTGVPAIYAEAARVAREYGAPEVAARLDTLAALAANPDTRAAMARHTRSPLDDLALVREQWADRLAVGGKVIAALAGAYLLSRLLRGNGR